MNQPSVTLLSKFVSSRIILPVAGSLILISSNMAFADFAVLVAEGVLVEKNPVEEVVPDDENTPTVTSDPHIIGSAINASYVSTGGWAVTGADFIDAAVVVYDFNLTGSVTQATLTLPLEDVFPQNGFADIEIFVYSDNGFVEFTDYSDGFSTPVASINATGLTQIELDVTGAVNSVLTSSRYVAFRVQSSLTPGSVSTTSIPAWTGVKLREEASLLQFTPGPAPILPNDIARFDGFTLQVPNIEVAGVGEAAIQLKVVDSNNLLFELTFAEITGAGVTPPPISGTDLFNCSAFSPPSITAVASGTSTYSVNSGILDIPSVNFNDEQLSFRLEYIEGTNPWIFETLSIGEVQSGPAQATISALGGGLIVESTQDFIPLCHGWVLIGDSTRNRVVERNLLSGETGATYPFNAIPDQFTLDRVNGAVYMTVHPETERLYRLDLNTGAITSNHISQIFTGISGSHTYSWTLRDLALGENGDIFALMFDNVELDPGDGIPYAGDGLWLGLMDPSANFLVPSIPLELPVRVEYDNVLDHVFLATESNLATFDFDPATNAITFISGTDVAVGGGCTDFNISPDGSRLAYSCPNGNRATPNFSIVDMSPVSYFDSDGEWFLGSSPVSATFNSGGTILIATDNEKLYFFDVVTHLILEDFELGLVEGETIRKIRISLDGQYLILFLQNEVHDESSKFYWMPMPAIFGTPLP